MAKKSFLAVLGFLLVFSTQPAFSQTASCGGIAGIECGSEQYCDFSETGSCGEGDQQGVCFPKPGFCSTDYNPVCGCDGVTYSNACFANAAGVSVAPLSNCVGPVSDGVEVLNCDSDASIQIVVCGIKDGENREYPNPCAAQNDGATNIVPQTGGSCAATQ